MTAALAVLETRQDAIVPADDALLEYVHGEQVEKPMGIMSTVLAFVLAKQLDDFARSRGLGVAVAEAMFLFQQEPRHGRRPDVAFVSRENIRQHPIPARGDWETVPDLAVEVVSPNDDITVVDQKVVEYFQFGVKQVWVLFPDTKRLYVHESLDHVSVVNEGQVIRGGLLLPEFTLPLADLFAAVPVAE